MVVAVVAEAAVEAAAAAALAVVAAVASVEAAVVVVAAVVAAEAAVAAVAAALARAIAVAARVTRAPRFRSTRERLKMGATDSPLGQETVRLAQDRLPADGLLWGILGVGDLDLFARRANMELKRVTGG